MVVLACLVAVTTIALLVNAPKKEAVRVWFVRSTNELGEKKLVFEGTNGLGTQLDFAVGLYSGTEPQMKSLHAGWPDYDWTIVHTRPRTNFSFALKSPPKEVSYYVMWTPYENPLATTRGGKFRSACYNFLRRHGMSGLADRSIRGIDRHYIPSTDIKE